MGDVYDLNVYKAALAQHYREGPCRCLGCRHEWTQRMDAGVYLLTCPKCGTLKGIPCQLTQRADVPTWHCQCGNDFVNILPDHMVLCPVCGLTTDML